MRLLEQANNLLRYARDIGVGNAVGIAAQKLQGRDVIRLHIDSIREPLYCRSGDLYVFLEVFGRKFGEVYDPALGGDPRLIVDAGANVGFASAMFANRFPHARVVAIEPDAKNCEIFRRNCEAYANVKLLHAAVWYRPGRMKIENPDDASFLFRVTEDQSDTGGIPALTFSQIIAESGTDVIDVLKLDVEGAEKVLFEHGSDWLRRVRLMIMELHDGYIPGCSDALFKAIEGRKYRHSRVKEIDLIEFQDV
jgi:FkbM family methyltransferase